MHRLVVVMAARSRPGEKKLARPISAKNSGRETNVDNRWLDFFSTEPAPGQWKRCGDQTWYVSSFFRIGRTGGIEIRHDATDPIHPAVSCQSFIALLPISTAQTCRMQQLCSNTSVACDTSATYFGAAPPVCREMISRRRPKILFFLLFSFCFNKLNM
ncbi:MAG: hypothetical protein A2521_03345 [Deltaproteobacteria bacterium RIFOXYD12_FULL_57_12]|nr:MAG: hypothetical protein A2521_03345 [Deltaproteobacteria bacterium RIFOXYD12_FULL_57_12]